MLNKALEALTGYSRDEGAARHAGTSCAAARLQDCPHGREAAAESTETDCINRHHRKIPVRITPRWRHGRKQPSDLHTC